MSTAAQTPDPYKDPYFTATPSKGEANHMVGEES